MALNPERIALLTAALRSGEYKQTQSRLTDGENFCCLGVACDLYRKHAGQGGEWAPVNCHGDRYFVAGPDDESRMTMPNAVKDWYGFTDQGGTFDTRPNNFSWGTLWKLNDRAGYSFEQLAEVIENNMDNL